MDQSDNKISYRTIPKWLPNLERGIGDRIFAEVMFRQHDAPTRVQSPTGVIGATNKISNLLKTSILQFQSRPAVPFWGGQGARALRPIKISPDLTGQVANGAPHFDQKTTARPENHVLHVTGTYAVWPNACPGHGRGVVFCQGAAIWPLADHFHRVSGPGPGAGDMRRSHVEGQM